jgi:transketolase
MADIFAALYFSFLHITPEDPGNPNRDYCLLSNGHICPIYYAALARKGFFPMEELQYVRKIGDSVSREFIWPSRTWIVTGGGNSTFLTA